MARKNINGLRVAVIVADGFEQVEVTSPLRALHRRGAVTEIISLRRGNIRGVNFLWPGKKVHVDRTIVTADPDDYDALLLPGGLVNPDLLRQNQRVLDFVREFDASQKPIAVICHGAWVLASAGLVQGRTLTSWPGIKDDILNAGGNWKDEGVVLDGNWVSGQSPVYLARFNRAMLGQFSNYRRAQRPVSDRGGLLPTLGWLAAGAAVVTAVLGGAARRNRPELEEKLESMDSTMETAP
jgi:protease I